MNRAVGAALVLAVVAVGWSFRAEVVSLLPSRVTGASPYERYAATIRARDLDETELGRGWLDAGVHAVENPFGTRPPFTRTGRFDLAHGLGAMAWRFPARRGQQIGVEVSHTSGEVFLDLFEDEGKKAVASANGQSAALVHDVAADAEFTVRIQPELLRGGEYRLAERSNASLEFPVQGVTARAIGSTFGDVRDAGRRVHQGVDIFAPRGTPVIAAADGFITGATHNALGGNVVFLWLPLRGVALYYAHLDRQAVSPGDRVRAGDIVGYVGNTGNARGASPHLHFGIYAARGGPVDPLPYVCDAPCPASPERTARATGERLMPRTSHR